MTFLVYTTPALTSPADNAQVELGFSEAAAVINGGLDNSNLSASAAIATSKLAASNYEFLVNLEVKPTTAVQPGTSATIPVAVVGMPGTNTEGESYTPISGTFYITDDGDAAATTTFSVEMGYASGGSWLQVGADVVSATNITGAGQTHQSGALANLSTAARALDATNPYVIGLFLTALGANALNLAYSSLSVTIKFRRTDGLRGT